MRHGVIYGLVDPRNGDVRYVGLTCLSTSKRFNLHIGSARHGERSYRSRWIRKLLRVGEWPFPVVLERSVDQELPDLERFWISVMRERVGSGLTNITEGGSHPSMPKSACVRMSRNRMGHVVSEETRTRLSEAMRGNQNFAGHRHSNETKTKMSEAQRGNTHFRGHRHTPETIEAMSRAKLGHPVSDEARENMSRGQISRWRRVHNETL